VTKTFKTVKLDGGLENCSVTLYRKFRREKEIKRNIESCAIKRALQLQSDGKICFSPVSEKIEASYHYPHARKISNLILFSTKGGKKDHK
jgi:hypothetical protein